MSHAVQTEKPNISSSAALWSVLIFVGLIIAAINFVQAEGKGEGHGAATEQHEHDGAAHEDHKVNGEHGTQPEQHTEETMPAASAHDSVAPAAESAHEEAHH